MTHSPATLSPMIGDALVGLAAQLVIDHGADDEACFAALRAMDLPPEQHDQAALYVCCVIFGLEELQVPMSQVRELADRYQPDMEPELVERQQVAGRVKLGRVGGWRHRLAGLVPR